MHEDKRCRPILFVLEGQEATGEQEPFPTPSGGHAGPSHQAGSNQQGPSNNMQSTVSTSSSHPSLTACSSTASMSNERLAKLEA